MKTIFFLSLLFLLCTPQKEEVTELDVSRVITRLSTIRIVESLEFDATSKKESRTDKQIFLDVCNILRLKPDLVLEKIQKSDTNLYKHLAN